MLKKSQAITEYAVIFSIALAALIGMKVYVQRAVQAKVKDLTDALIAPQGAHIDQINEIDPLLGTEGNLKKMTDSQYHLQETKTDNNGVITVTKQIPSGEAHTLHAETKFMVVDDPAKETNDATSTANPVHGTSPIAWVDSGGIRGGPD